MAIEGIEQPEIIQINRELRLRKFDGIYDFAFDWYQDEETVYLVDGVRKKYSQETLKCMYEYLDKQGELYFIEVLENDVFKPIGDVTFWKKDMPIVIGDKAYRGKGIAKNVIGALIQRGRVLGYTELYVNEIYDFNIASRKCFENMGFVVCEKTDKGNKYVLKIYGQKLLQ
ncbi:MAG: GNAT family N-acetyltransferase [Agathobacter sp.]|nr:GNAT family N-acetyltransferase [Agathobacter sp.]